MINELVKEKLIKLSEDTSLVNKEQDDLIAAYYLHFIKDLTKSPHLETFANLILSYRGYEKEYDEWVKANPLLVTQFKDWLKNYPWNKQW